MRIAIQGIAGSFHDIAARRFYGARHPGEELQMVECKSFEDTFAALRSGQADAAMVAIENSIAGSILGNYHLLEQNAVSITGEVYVRIQHHLVALPGQRLGDIHKVLGHPVAVPQCSEFLQAHPDMRVEEFFDTASSARHIQQNRLAGVAAIAGYGAASLYGLEILAERIENVEHNYTRFLALAPAPLEIDSTLNKATLSIRVSHRAGALAEALAILKQHHINLSKIQSVPIVDVPFEYAIHLDLIWEDLRDYRNALATLGERALEVCVLGVYRQGDSDLQSMAQHTYPSALQAKPVATVDDHPNAGFLPASDWRDWVFTRSAHQPDFALIAGPCSAESEDQLLQTARELKATGWPCILRAGIWKPRTRAGGFEGHGIQALEWLREAKRETSLPVAVEVAGASHVEACLAYGVDIVWVGARTTGNPFSVQEIADALRGTDAIVLVKNPISPDVDLWIGAIERLARAGLTRLGAIHRGFASLNRSGLRNPPEWSLALQFMQRLPQIPLICDPSHIVGKREGLAEISQRALDLGMSGLMLEVHHNPEEAWTDASQQLTPSAYGEMMAGLTWRPASLVEESLDGENWAKLETLRSSVDRLDHELIELLASRMKVVQQIGEYKKIHGLEVFQENRWNALMERRLAHGESLELNPLLIEALFEQVHHESLRIQAKLRKTS
ncbi:MAG: chorismate mutase [Armatimonadetes bacterium]|nr:chorismate mutase [Armatimonadota bacterium]